METVKRFCYYPIADYSSVPRRGGKEETVAKWTGERRPPRAGEWFLSGAIITAYQAKNDLNTSYHIAKLVKIRKVETIEEIDL